MCVRIIYVDFGTSSCVDRSSIGLFQFTNAPPPHRGCQNLLQNLPGNPDCKILSMCGNPDDFWKTIWKSWILWQKLGIWSNFIKKIWKCGLKWSKFSGISVLETTKKVWNSDLLYGGGHFLSGRAHFWCTNWASPH